MARRKGGFLSDGSDSDASVSDGSDGGYNSQEDGDSKAERALFEHNGNKRRKTGGRGGKEAAWEGIFGEEEDSGRSGGRGFGSRRGGRGGEKSRTDWTKAPTFVPIGKDASKAEPIQQPNRIEAAEHDEEHNSSQSGSDEEDEDGDTPPVASPRVREEEEEASKTFRPGLGGMGFKKAGASDAELKAQAPITEGDDPQTASRAGLGSSSKAGIGSGSRGGLGSSSRAGLGSTKRSGETTAGTKSTPAFAAASEPGPSSQPPESGPSSRQATPPREKEVPTAFGRRNVETPREERESSRPQQSFRPREAPVAPPPKTNLTSAEAAHFAKIDSDFGAKFLKNFGWSAGEGLGKEKTGRAVPIAVGKVFKGQGLKSGMRTEDSKREARRNGEVFSEDEDEKPRRGKKAGPKGQKQLGEYRETQTEQSWRKQKKVKVKVEHKTYEQLLAEAGDAPSGVGLVLDARGGELKEVSSLSALNLSGWTPTAENAQLPELRHNLRLIVDVSKADVDALAREGKAVAERKRWAAREEQVALAKMEDCAKRLSRLQLVQAHVTDISSLAAQQVTQSEPSIASLAKSFTSLLNDFKKEYEELGLDDVIVGAIGQVLRSVFADWSPFDLSSDVLLSQLKQWKHAYRLPKNLTEEDDPYRDHHPRNGHEGTDQTMTAWESLLWTMWLPRVRSAINNDWSAFHPQPAVHLIESWSDILPDFVRDNILDQLILPKVHSAIEEWDGRPSRSGKSRSLAGIVFPWLPLLGGRIEEVMEIAKRRIRHVLKKWTAKEGVPEELLRWKKDIFSHREWDEMMLKYVVPKLGASLRDDFQINPRKQDMVPLEQWVLPWSSLLRASTFEQLLEVNFFPKWLDILYIWLVQPNYKPDEVATWFTWWKDRFPKDVLEMRGIAHGFNAGIELMHQATVLGSSAQTQLPKPNYQPLAPRSSKSSTSRTHQARSLPTPSAGISRPSVPTDEETITFRTLAEDIATQNDLLFLPIGKSHQQTGKPLFRVSKTVDGKGGVTVYVGQDAVFAQMDDGAFRAVSLDDMVKRASS